MESTKRLAALRERMRREKLGAFASLHLPNLRYLTGFTGSAGLLLVQAEEAHFYTDGRYREQARLEVRGAQVHITGNAGLYAAAAHRLGRVRRIGVEASNLTLAAASALGGKEWKNRLLPTTGWIEQQRARKTPDEIARLRRAAQLASGIWPRLLKEIQPGKSERAVAARIEFELRRAGGDGCSFEPIVAAGARGARPHARASAQALRRGDLVVLDYGVWREGYASDMTRTVAVGRASARAREVYRAVLEAQLAAIAAVRPGVPAPAVDAAARRVLRKHKLLRYFVHSTGHGVGLEIHENPRLGQWTRRDQPPPVLETGNVITIEPGVYLPGWGGVRIEDMVHVTDGGAEILTPTPKELLEL